MKAKMYNDDEWAKETSKFVNRNFVIKIWCKVNGENFMGLVGFNTLRGVVKDDPLLERLIDRAYKYSETKCTCKLRRGVTIVFYTH